MIDLNDLRIFVRVATLRNFSGAARELDIPRSSVSRGVLRLETALGVRLLQRTTREVVVTEAGVALLERSADQLESLGEAFDYVNSFTNTPRGLLSISSSIGFGINILSKLIPDFLSLHPDVDVVLDLSSRPADLVGERVDIAIRMGALPDGEMLARRLGAFTRYCCASPDYVASHGTPTEIEHLRDHQLIDFPLRDGHKYSWFFERGGVITEHHQTPRVTVNCALTLHKMLLNGAGVGISPGYLCVPDIKAGRLLQLFPDWRMPPALVHAVFPSRRELAPKVRAFIDFMVHQSKGPCSWQSDGLEHVN